MKAFFLEYFSDLLVPTLVCFLFKGQVIYWFPKWKMLLFLRELCSCGFPANVRDLFLLSMSKCRLNTQYLNTQSYSSLFMVSRPALLHCPFSLPHLLFMYFLYPLFGWTRCPWVYLSSYMPVTCLYHPCGLLPPHLPIHQSNCPPTSLPIFLFNCPPVYLPICLPNYPPV